jgi:hypothetical protein
MHLKLLYYFYFILFYLFTQLLSFSINKAKVKFAKINIAMIYLYGKLLLLFMKVITQSSLIKIQHQVNFLIKKGHINISTMLNLKRPMDVLA